MKPRGPLIPLFGALAILGLAAPAAAVTIFSHTFDEGAGGLNGTPVDGGTLAPQNWVAAGVVTANGAFASGAGSATLAFTPSDGFEYQLDARVLNVTGNANWVALGFANGQGTTASNFNRFITGSATDPGVVGTAWMLFRGDNDPNPNFAYVGNGTLGLGNHGLTDGSGWSDLNFQDGSTPGTIDLRILLDTTGGSGNWTVTWLAKLNTETVYTTVRPTEDALIEGSFTSVGFAFSAGGATNLQGTLQSFSLTAVPEPSAALLGGLGLMALLRRRR